LLPPLGDLHLEIKERKEERKEGREERKKEIGKKYMND
jgi:hypothetical protein